MPQPIFVTTIVFGELASKSYESGETCNEKLNEQGSVQTFTFKSSAEQDAFLDGVEAASGWLDYAIKQKTPAIKAVNS